MSPWPSYALDTLPDHPETSDTKPWALLNVEGQQEVGFSQTIPHAQTLDGPAFSVDPGKWLAKLLQSVEA